MLIEFMKPDPRAGTQARLDSNLAQQFIDAGSAVRVSEDASAADAPALPDTAPAQTAVVPAAAKPVRASRAATKK